MGVITVESIYHAQVWEYPPWVPYATKKMFDSKVQVWG